VLPPKVAPVQVVIIPLIHKPDMEAEILSYCNKLKDQLKAQNIRVEVDIKEKTPGEKSWGWIKKGVPIKLEIGAKEVAANSVFMGRRDFAPNEKSSINKDELISNAVLILEEIQNNLYKKAASFRDANLKEVTSKEEFYNAFGNEENKSGFVAAYWIGDDETEDKLKQDLKVTSRCIPLDSRNKLGKCIFTGKENAPLTIFARAY